MEVKTYWNHKGRFEDEYNELIKANFKFTKAEENAMYKYHRYFNDGDIPVGAKYYSTRDIERYLEFQADVVVARAYMRFNKEKASKLIAYFAKKKLIGFDSYINNSYKN